MDSPGPIDDEVIADSEGEMDDEEHPGILKDTGSQVSAFTSPGHLHNTTTSSISAFTAGPSKQTSNTGGQLNQFSDADNFLGTASIADRAKTRQRNRKSSESTQRLSTTKPKPDAIALSDDRLEKQKSNRNVSFDVIELSDEEDDELSLRPKPKPRPKTKPKLKVKDKRGNTSNDKPLDVSSTTETNTDKSPYATLDLRPRPRPRPLVKRSKAAQESTVPPQLLPFDIPGLLPSSASASHGPELPIATSPIRPQLDASQLPPSDPPLPSLTTIHDENEFPPIETLHNLDFDGPLSSPSSLFSDFGGTTKKRKRAVLDLDVDELASDVDLDSGKRGIGAAQSEYDDVTAQAPSHMLPSPPTFFAGSSSSSIGGGDRRIPLHVPSLAHDVVDLTMLPPTIQPIGAVTTKKTTKAKTSRKKKGDALRMDGDKLDDDFDPTIVLTQQTHGKIYVNPPTAMKKGKKGKNVARPDEDDEECAIEVDLDPSAGLSKGQKPASRIEGDTDEERSTKKQKGEGKRSKTRSKKPVEDGNKDGNVSMEDHQDIQDQQLAPEAKENVIPPRKSIANTAKTDDKPNVGSPGLFPSLYSRYEIAPRRSSLPMSELIRRANSIPGSPFATPHPHPSSSSTGRPIKSGTTVTYSPYLKSSRSLLSRIAPLHPNRRTPPLPTPAPPPKKKTKKELEMEEKWEEEMIESVGGISEWTSMADDEKKELRRAKWAKEMGDWDD